MGIYILYISCLDVDQMWRNVLRASVTCLLMKHQPTSWRYLCCSSNVWFATNSQRKRKKSTTIHINVLSKFSYILWRPWWTVGCRAVAAVWPRSPWALRGCRRRRRPATGPQQPRASTKSSLCSISRPLSCSWPAWLSFGPNKTDWALSFVRILHHQQDQLHVRRQQHRFLKNWIQFCLPHLKHGEILTNIWMSKLLVSCLYLLKRVCLLTTWKHNYTWMIQWCCQVKVNVCHVCCSSCNSL